MRVRDLHILPKVRDGWSFLYVEKCRIDQEAKAIAIHDASGKTPVPCANLALLMLGPGVSITHSAVSVLADHGCLVAWCGEQGVRFYAMGMGETRDSSNLLHQAGLWANPESRLQVIRNFYQARFPEKLPSDLTLQQIRGKEGVRVREAYAEASRVTGVPWEGRSYKRDSWSEADPVNRALSTANSCLYGLCHAAVVSVGLSPALGFIHTGKMLSFVYDVADLYKTEVTIPIAFRAAAQGMEKGIEQHVRINCRDSFVENNLLKRIIPDIQKILMMSKNINAEESRYDQDAAEPGQLWDLDHGAVSGGRLHSVNESDYVVPLNDSPDS